MFRIFRHTRVTALLVLLVIAGSVPVSVSALIHEADDEACQPTIVVHDETAHRIGGAPISTKLPEHCAVCHWLHSLQTVVIATSVGIDASAVAHLVLPPTAEAVRHSTSDVPARAPPRIRN